MWKNKHIKWFGFLLVLLLILAACNKQSAGDDKSKPKTQKTKEHVSEKTVEQDFPLTVMNDEEILEDGILKYGLVTDSPFEGTLSRAYYSKSLDDEILQFFDVSLLTVDENYEFTNDGAATFDISEDGKTITLKIRDNVNWADGEPVKSTDLEYSYLVIGSPEYTGPRLDTSFRLVEGMDEYHEGKADKISGIEIIDDKTIAITLKEKTPTIRSGIWPYPMPEHYLKDIPISEQAQSDKVRTNPLGYGPFKVKKIVPGESVELERNEGYWKGKPNLKGVIIKVVNPNVVVAALEKGEIDYIKELPTDQYEKVKDLSNIQILGELELFYSYLAFKQGYWDEDKEEIIMTDSHKFTDKRLRQAFGYAVDKESVAEKFYHGLRTPATTFIPPIFSRYHDQDEQGYYYDPEKAKALLDEAGYVDVDGDGFREDPDGNKFTVNFLTTSGSEVAEPIAQFYIQNWKDVGLNVQLQNGRLYEGNSFYDLVKNDDPDIDLFMAAFGTGSDVDPSGFFGRDSSWNYWRWTNEKNDELLAKGISPEAVDIEYRQQVYKEWQALTIEEAPAIPMHYRYRLHAVNNRMKNLSIDPNSDLGWSDVAVTKEKPEVAK